MKNDLSVWTYPYRKTYYLTHPWAWIKETYWNFRNWWHRGKYGFAYVDAWNWCDWWTKVGAKAIKYLADNGHGYPGVLPWETQDVWKDYLYDVAADLEWCSKSCDFDGEEDNEYYKAFKRAMDKAWHETKDENGFIKITYDLSPEDEEIKDNYFNKIKKLTKENELKREKILGEIGRNLPRFWD